MMKPSDTASLDRRGFLARAAAGGAGLALAPSLVRADSGDSKYLEARAASDDMVDNGPAADEVLAFEFVHKSHFDLDRVKELHAEVPELVNSSWDWGDGDFESALGAASHMGNRDIANFLLENGARPNLFTAAMLGHLDIVRGFLDRYPHLKECPGPHGLSLVHHAEKGAEPAEGVLEYLKSLA